MPDRENTTNYQHPQETNLLGLHKAMQYDVLGQPTVRTKQDLGRGATSAFNEPISVPITPVIQLDGLYGLPAKNFETFAVSGGVADTTDTLMRVQSSATIGSFGVIRSTRTVRYRAGQGALARFTAAFTTGAALYTQQAGFFNVEQSIMVGYDGVDFGVLRSNGGKVHIELLTVTVGATGADDVTITLDNVAYVVPVTINDANITAAEISEWFQDPATGPVTLWVVEHCDGIVHFVRAAVGPVTGTMSFAAGSTGSTANVTTEREGVVATTNWTHADAFNIDNLDGTGPSGITIDPTQMNIYQISFHWLGVGVISYDMESPDTGETIPFHRETFANTTAQVPIDNPSLQLGYVSASIGGTGSVLTVTGGSMMGAIQGVIEHTTLPTAAFVAQAEAPSLTTNDLHHALTVHNRITFHEKLNTHELIISEISVGFSTSPAGGPVEVLLFYNFAGLPLAVNKIISLNESAAFYSDALGVLTQGANFPIHAFFASGGASQTINLEQFRITLAPNTALTVAIRSVDLISRKSVAITFIED